MKQLRDILVRLANVLFTLVLVGCLLSFGLLAVGPHVFGYRTATMLTGSMEPGITPGDVVVSVPRPAQDVKVGDVISYHIPVEDHRVETHRVIEVINNEDGTIAVRTQGDANAEPDPWTATLEGDTVWEMQAVVPWIGNGIRALRTPFVQDNVFWAAIGLALMLGLSMIWSRNEDEEELMPTPAPARLPVSVPAATEASHASYVAALTTLADDLDPDYAVFYAGQWREMLPSRLERVSTAVDARDFDAAMDSVLSLKVSSASVGASDLSDAAAFIEAAVREGSWETADSLVAMLPQVAERSQQELVSCLAA